MHSNIKAAKSYRLDYDLWYQSWMEFGFDKTANTFSVPGNGRETKKGCWNFQDQQYPDWFVVHQAKDLSMRLEGSYWKAVA